MREKTLALVNLNSLLSGIVIAYLKITEKFKIFAHAHTRKERKQEKRFGKNDFFRLFSVFRGQNFLVFKTTAILRPLSNDLNWNLELVFMPAYFTHKCVTLSKRLCRMKSF